jgi:tRNA-specific 2-thiouridylase
MYRKKKKSIVLISGGVDSSNVTFLVKRNFFYIECIFIKNWNEYNENVCFFKSDLFHVQSTCKKINAYLHILDYTKTYWVYVFIRFLKDLKKGLTPNPDIICNKEIKFKIFTFYAIFYLNFDFLITGHYSSFKINKKKFSLYRNFDYKKDQSYFLFNINRKVRKYIIFPLSNYIKYDIRKFLKLLYLINFNKRSSKGICFIGEKDFSLFIKKYLKINSGNVLDNNNMIIDRHDGVFLYTIGQRFVSTNKNNKFYVYKKDNKKNNLYVTKDENLLLSNKIMIKKLNFKVSKKMNFYAKIRHSVSFEKVIVQFDENQKKYIVFFKKKQEAIAIGQSIVFYDKNICIGGAIISNIF